MAFPVYECTVSGGMVISVNMESTSPLDTATQSDWRTVYNEVRGTMINYHRIRNGSPDILLWSYTLQHAEIGLASDTNQTIFVPSNTLVALVPDTARPKTYGKHPHMYQKQEQTVIRLRVETDQLLMAHSSKKEMLQLILFISTGINIAPDIDERRMPEYDIGLVFLRELDFGGNAGLAVLKRRLSMSAPYASHLDPCRRMVMPICLSHVKYPKWDRHAKRA